MQLKNELYRVQMKDLPMQQYLTRIKSLVDNISASGSQIDPEDIMLHILNGLPPTFNSFKSTIRNSLQPIDLDTFTPCFAMKKFIFSMNLLKIPLPMRPLRHSTPLCLAIATIPPNVSESISPSSLSP
ncbi:hypothetical protein MA16_Dca014102 [Dendrobium catenatum]|uniref:Retrovirus-related Pol polyprotein from transposon TNT 1-94 n=1 Tax=Dendrobium catenatum TaxID=906689 RepID=A0A2I0VS77_9ASPA|nr:hypothetical protein MA16_Dca014102 [Dendrobium catenatum]